MQSPATRPGSAAAARQPGAAPARIDRIWVHPRFRTLPPPIIVIGMHRSGTSLVAGLLSRLGVYMGPKVRLPKEGGPIQDQHLMRCGYGEAEEFVYLNDSLLRSAGGSWNDPEPFLSRRSDCRFVRRCVTRLQRATAGSLAWDYLAAMPGAYRGNWGWKDPRNTLTLPFWLALFPEATVIHVRRQPGAAAASLHRRALEDPLPPGPPLPPRERVRWWLRRPGEALTRLGRRLRLAEPPEPRPDPCRDVMHCERLTRTYLAAASPGIAPQHRWVELWYEEVMSSPRQAVELLADQLQTPVSDTQFQSALNLIGIGSPISAGTA